MHCAFLVLYWREIAFWLCWSLVSDKGARMKWGSAKGKKLSNMMLRSLNLPVLWYALSCKSLSVMNVMHPSFASADCMQNMLESCSSDLASVLCKSTYHVQTLSLSLYHHSINAGILYMVYICIQLALQGHHLNKSFLIENWRSDNHSSMLV